MADVNNSPGKRKTANSEIIFNVEDGKENPSDPAQNGTDEPAIKTVKKEEITEASDSNLYQELSQASIDTNISVIEKLTELQEENMKLKRQLEELNNKMCKCALNISGSDESDAKPESLMTIKFHNEATAEGYKSKFVKFLQSFIELTCTQTNLSIDIARKETTDEIDLMSPSKKRKRKKSKSKSKDLFTVDTTPTVTRIENTLKYVSKYLVSTDNELSEKDNRKCSPSPICFNCDQNHALRDCPNPKNFAKINAARNKMKHLMTKTRYHTDDEQKYAHLKPGEISGELKKALGICPNELPPYIYRMRRCGYPPGWIEDAQVTHSNISLYDIDGKELSVKNNKSSIDPNKVIEYPGFNMPLDKGIKDDYKYYDCPPYSEQYSKGSMLNYINQKFLKAEDNLETCDMELDQSSDDTMAPPGCEPQPVNDPPTPTSDIPTTNQALPPVITQIQQDSNRLSPSLVDLEQKKKELLAELGENNNTNSSVTEEKTDTVQVDSTIGEVEVEDPNDSVELNNCSYIIIDDSEARSGLVQQETSNDELNVTIDPPNEPNIAATTPTADSLKKSTFGTPIVKGASPYNQLPDPINFSKDISPVINFENLPNATGKYDQMTCILQKIRRTLKNSNDKL